MANIYKEKEVADYQNRFYSSEGNIGRQLLREAPQHERQAMALENQAQNLYSKGLEIEWQNTANELLNNPDLSKNPKGLQEELKKVTNNIAGTIEDKDVKLDFLVNSEIDSTSYINRAMANLKKEQDRRTRDIAENQIYASIDSISRSLYNSVSGVSNGDELASVYDSINKINQANNAVYSDGSRVFSQSQLKSYKNMLDKAIFDQFKNAYDDLPQNKKDELYNALESGTASFAKIKTEDGEKDILVKDILSPESYSNVKRYIRQHKDDAYKLQKYEIEKQNFLQKQQILANEMKISSALENMSDVDQINYLEENRDLISDKYYNAKKKAITSVLAITPKTNAETFSNMMQTIRSLSVDDPKDFVERSSELLTSMEEAVSRGELLRKDKQILINALNNTEKPDIEETGDKLKGFFSPGFDYQDASIYIKNNLSDDKMGYDTLLNYYRTIENKGYNSDQRRQALATLVEKENRDSFRNGVVKSGSIFSTIDSYFKETLPENMQQLARENFLDATLFPSGNSLELQTKYRNAAGEVVDKIKAETRLKAQDSYANVINKSDDNVLDYISQKTGKTKEKLNIDIDFTAKKYGLTREQVINKLKGGI